MSEQSVAALLSVSGLADAVRAYAHEPLELTLKHDLHYRVCLSLSASTWRFRRRNLGDPVPRLAAEAMGRGALAVPRVFGP